MTFAELSAAAEAAADAYRAAFDAFMANDTAETVAAFRAACLATRAAHEARDAYWGVQPLYPVEVAA